MATNVLKMQLGKAKASLVKLKAVPAEKLTNGQKEKLIELPKTIQQLEAELNQPEQKKESVQPLFRGKR